MSETVEVDYLILGAGPGGLQLGYYLDRAHRRYMLLEEGDSPGTFFKTMPRHRRLLSINKIHTGHDDPELNLRWDWNSLLTDDYEPGVRKYTDLYFPQADTLVQYLKDFADQQRLNVCYSTKVLRVRRDGAGFIAEDQRGLHYRCQWLIVATGLSRPFLPDIPGIEFAEHYANVSINPEDFRNERVLIIGKGNSGFETANNLIDTAAVIHIASPTCVTFAWETHHIGNLRSVNHAFLDTYLLKAKNATLEVKIETIESTNSGFEVSIVYQRAQKSRARYCYDRIIACTGFRFNDDIFGEGCRPDTVINNRLPSMNCRWESANVSNMYFAGTLMQTIDYKKASSSFIHGFRYNVRALHRILEQRNHGRPWPSIQIASWPQDVVSMIIRRLNQSSGLWLQFGFLGDLIVEPSGDDSGCYFEEVPVDYARSLELCGPRPFYIVTLEYGRSDFDPLRDDRVAHTDVEHAMDSTALHPVIRRYQGDQLIAERHLVENLEAMWRDEKLHVEPLRQFFAREELIPPIKRFASVHVVKQPGLSQKGASH